MIRISRLNDARDCGLSASLDTKSTTEAGLMGDAFHAAAAAFYRPTDDRLQAARAVAMGRLDPDARFEVEQLLAPLFRTWTAPADARFEVPVGVDRHGLFVDVERGEDDVYRARPLGIKTPAGVTLDPPPILTAGTADVAWVTEEGDRTVVHVPDLKSGARARFNVPPPDRNLQVAAYGFGLADKYGAAVMELGLYLAHDEEWKWHRVDIASDEATGLWEEVRAAALRDPGEAVLGGHCADCWVRLRCPAYLLPALDQAARDEALAPLAEMAAGVIIEPSRLARAIHALSAMKDVSEAGRETMKAYVKEHGPVVDGGKQWGPVDVKGRETTSVKALVEAGLYETAHGLGAIKLSPPSQQHRWTNMHGRKR